MAGWQMIDDPQNIGVASAISIWEAAIKFGLDRNSADRMPMSGQQLLHECTRAQTEVLSVSPAHAARTDQLPLIHRDPFDRLLIAQAQSESMNLLTHDKTLAAYGNFVIVV